MMVSFYFLSQKCLSGTANIFVATQSLERVATPRKLIATLAMSGNKIHPCKSATCFTAVLSFTLIISTFQRVRLKYVRYRVYLSAAVLLLSPPFGEVKSGYELRHSTSTDSIVSSSGL